MLRKFVAGLLVAGLSAGLTGIASAAQARPSAQPELSGLDQLIDAIVPDQLAKDKIPGAAVVVVAGGRQVFAKGYGVADTQTRTPVNADRTGFFTGSLAKVFTATAVLQLVNQGKLDLYTDVNRYLTSFKIRDTYPGHPLTLDNLLTHTAGFDDNPLGVAVSDPAAVPQLGRYLAERQPARVRAPGTMASYDNYGVALAGYLVEVVSGQPFAQYVEQYITQPLGMTATSFAQPHPASIEATMARGYRPSGDGQTPENGQYGGWSPTGAGTVSTATDMGRFMLAQISDDARLGQRVAAQIQEQHFTQDQRLPGMGYLLEQRPRNGKRLLFKDGDVPGFHSNLALLPDQGVGIYVSYNGDGVDGTANWDGKSLIHHVVDHYFPDTSARPKANSTPEVSQDTVGTYDHFFSHASARPRAISTSDVSQFTGVYRVTRTSHTDLTKVAALTSSVTVNVANDGTLTTSGLSPNPHVSDQHWVQIQPGLFQERDGQDQIAFDGKGNLFATADPTVAYLEQPWYSNPLLQQGLLGFGLLVLLIGLVGFPIVALVRRLRGRPGHPRGAKAARLAAWLTAALVTSFAIGFTLVTADGNAFNESVILGSGLLTTLLAQTGTAVLTTAAMIAGTVAAWWKRWWGRTGRLCYSLTTVAAVSFLATAFTYNLVGSPFN